MELKQRGMRGCFVDWVDLKGTYQELGMIVDSGVYMILSCCVTNTSLHRIYTMGEI